MSTIDVSDIQGIALKGYNFPYARYLLIELLRCTDAQRFIGSLLPHITTGERWDEKPLSTVNVAFTHKGLVALQLPMSTLLSFPVEFQQGMKARGDILYDTGLNAPDHWDNVWQEDRVHVWLAVHARTPEALESRCVEMQRLMNESDGAKLLQAQPAGSIFIDGKPCTKEHFGYTDGFGNPDFKGAERECVPGQGKLTAEGGWEALATGEFLLGYADEAGELPVAPVPHLLARNGTFMAYRNIDDSADAGFQIIGAVVLPELEFRPIEEYLAGVIDKFVPEELRDTFEFHASANVPCQGTVFQTRQRRCTGNPSKMRQHR